MCKIFKKRPQTAIVKIANKDTLIRCVQIAFAEGVVFGCTQEYKTKSVDEIVEQAIRETNV